MKRLVPLVVLVLFSVQVFPEEIFSKVIKKLNVSPSPQEGGSSPYTHDTEDNLIAIYSEEIRIAKSKIDPSVSKPARNKILFERMGEENKKVEEKLRNSSDGKNAETHKKIAQKVFESLSSHNVTKIDAVERYDKRGDIGFCFGRAAMVHYLLLENGIKQDQIAKIFVVGRLKFKGQLWDFHMATMVKGEKGEWLVIDSLHDQVLPHTEWIKRAHTLDIKPDLPQLRFYVTDARKFQPAYKNYRVRDFQIPDLKQYFTELFSSLQK
jgi:hypothetical protein